MYIIFTRLKMAYVFSTALVFADSSFGSTIMVRVGPAAVGNGGPNPISLPPANPVEYEFSYITDADREFNVSISPGLFYGFRSQMANGIYVSLGPGLVINANGTGFGGFSAFGYESCGWICFNIEYKQALGWGNGNLISPYAIRIATGIKF